MADQYRFGAVLETISKASSLFDMSTELANIRDIYGLANVVYHAVRIPRNEQRNPILLLTYDQSWVSRYIERDYFDLDPVVLNGRNGFLPIDWKEVDRTSPYARYFFAEADRYGVGRNGLTLPIRGVNGERALFTVTSNCSDRDWSALRLTCLRDFQMIGHYVHDRSVQIAGLRRGLPARRPSRRELQCLEAFSRGSPPKRIAADLGVSESAVRLYLHSIRRKLECTTVPQAIGVALDLELICV